MLIMNTIAINCVFVEKEYYKICENSNFFSDFELLNKYYSCLPRKFDQFYNIVPFCD